jgi:pyridoxal/pyridoxine/pyridoxamine kinase
MLTALILSSFVAANRIGGGAQQVALTALGFEAFLAPTVLLGRNPVRGAAGEAVAPEVFQGLVDALEAEGLFARADLVITGYFASAAQAAIAADALTRVRAAATRRLGVRALVSSAPAGPSEVGLLLCDGPAATLYAHRRRAEAPNGTGDLVTAVFAAGLVQGLAPEEAAAAAAAAAGHMVDAAAALGDLPLAQLARALREPAPDLRMEPLGGPA